jgi:flagellar hook-length control protein FliK
VEVRIASHEGGLRISLEAAQSGARDLMERSLPALQQALEARDLRVERLNVQATDTGRGSLDTSAGGQQSGGSDAHSGDGGPEWSAVASFGAGAEAVTGGPSQSQTADGRLDVMA